VKAVPIVAVAVLAPVMTGAEAVGVAGFTVRLSAKGALVPVPLVAVSVTG
jgi:hypothetical protein